MKRILPIAGLLLLLPIAAHAQDAAAVPDQVLQAFRGATAGFAGPLLSLAQDTFFVLAGISFAWAVLKLALQRADMSEILAAVVNQLFFIGIFEWAMNAWTTWAPLIIRSFQYAAGQAGGSTFTPGGVVSAGVAIATKVWAQTSLFRPGDSVILGFCGLLVLVCFALVAIEMVIALIRSYFVTYAGVFFLLFGGSVWTSDIAINLVRRTIGIGARLFAIQLIVSVGMTLITQWSTQAGDVTAAGMAAEIVEALMLLVLVHIVPSEFEQVVGGAVFSGAGAFLGAAAGTVAAGAAATQMAGRAAVSTAGAGAAVGSAAGAASRQISGVGRSSAGRVAAIAGRTATNAAKAAVSDIGRRLGGQTMTRGSMGWRMAADLKQQPPPPGRP